MKQIRNSAKAIIIKDEKILLQKNQDVFGIFYLLPGGGQEPGELLVEALKRECLEEISTEVIVRNLRYIREYIGRNHEFAKWDSEVHQIEYMFVCSIKPGFEAKNGGEPDKMQIGVEWIELLNLNECRIYPQVLKSLISNDGSLKGETYLGDVN